MPLSLEPPRTQIPTLDFTRSPKVTQGGVGFGDTLSLKIKLIFFLKIQSRKIKLIFKKVFY